MSIIHDALKKIESINMKNKTIEAPKNKPKPAPKVYLFYIIIACLGFFAASLAFNFLSGSGARLSRKSTPVAIETAQPFSATPNIPVTVSQTKTQPDQQESTRTEPVATPQETPPSPPTAKKLPRLILNGVFFAEDNCYALINNRIVREGEDIEGVTVKRIAAEEVELDFEGTEIRLTTSNR